MVTKNLRSLKEKLVKVQVELKSFMTARFLQDGVSERIVELEKEEIELKKAISSLMK